MSGTALERKVALVTGGASGLGLAIARALRSAGADIVITDINAAEGARTALAEEMVFLTHDVADELGWQVVMDEVEAQFGGLDILVNNAGITGPHDHTNPEVARFSDWRRIFAVNVDSVFLGCRAAIAMMRKRGGGSIVNISSIAGSAATSYAVAYGATKAAVTQMTRSVAQHCAEQDLNIRCNSVHPGNVRTGMWDVVASERAKARGITVEAVLAETAARSPLPGFTMPEDVADAVLFLVSDASHRMTGTQLVVDGGASGCDTFHLSQRFKKALTGPGTD